MADVKETLAVSDAASCDVETTNTDAEEPAKILSKSQLKKIKRKERWEQVKGEKRKKEKERSKARKRELREKGELGPTRKQLRYNTMKKSDCRVQVAIDCGFDEYMSEKDIKMLVKQIQFSYSANRRAVSPLQFYCCGVGGKTKDRLESLGDYKGWDINFKEESYEELFRKPDIVYLSSESPNVLHTLEENKVYVIGGLVDHNHEKGLCHRLAEEKGLYHAQLPIAEFLDMKTRKVLAINHVFEILLHYTETKDWQKSFYAVLPPRKGAVLKVKEGSNDQTKEKGDSCNTDKITDSASKLEDVDKELPVDKSDNETDRQSQEIDGDLSASGQQTDTLNSSVTSKQSDISDSASKLEDVDKELTVDKSDSETDRQPQEIDGDLSASGQQTDKLDSSVTSEQSDITDKISDNASKLKDVEKESTVDKSDNETDRQPPEIDGGLSASGQQTDTLDSSVTSKQSDISDKDLKIDDKHGSEMNSR